MLNIVPFPGLRPRPEPPGTDRKAQSIALIHGLGLAAGQAAALGLSETARRLNLLAAQAAAEIFEKTGDTAPLRLTIGP